MRKVAKLMGISLLVLGLAACDGDTKDTKASAGDAAASTPAGLEPIRRYTVAESATWAQPAISGNRVYVKDLSALALWTFH